MPLFHQVCGREATTQDELALTLFRFLFAYVTTVLFSNQRSEVLLR